MKRFSLLTLLACLALTQTHAQVLSQDSLALVNIYNTTNGNGWTQKWNRSQPVSTWFGVTVTSGRVTALILPNNNLTGKLLSGTVAKLTGLKVLQLQNNQIGDGLPGGIGSLTSLELLDLSFNNLSGNILSSFFNNLPNLQKFNVAHNNLSGWIPANISNSTALTEINLSNNGFSNKIPTSINSLTNLTKFLVANNQLIGPMPTGILCSSSVQVDISGNAFNFSGVECLGSNPNAVYNNQQNRELAQNGSTLSIAAGGTLANNTYTWYRNSGAAPYFVSNGTTNKLNTNGVGKYWAVITNSAASGLTLKSDTILLTGSLTTDSLALVDLYNSTNGPGWTNKTNWLTSAPISQWFGVGINEGRVESLSLPGNNLVGVLPPSFGNLPLAYELNLSDNKLSGGIPSSFISGSIAYVYLSNNLFTSLPPDFTLTSIDLNLSHNQLRGPLPAGIDAHTGSLDLRYNRLTFTEIESLNTEIAKTYPQASVPLIHENPVLKVAAGGTLSNNTYKWYKGGTLVATKTGDSSFTYTEIGSYHATVMNSAVAGVTLNSDTVNITTLGSLTTDSLALVDFYNNITSGLNWVLTDPVSTWEGVTVDNGRVAILYVGGLSGTISPSIGNLSELTTLYIDFFTEGNLTGSIPATVANLSKLQELIIGPNNLTGAIPDDIGRNQPELFNIYIWNNPLTGTIPSGLEYASSLLELYISNTQISGTIPLFFNKLPLFSLELSNNQLTGSIPDSLFYQGLPGYLNLNNNFLTGPIPNWTQGGFGLNLSHNQLSGSLPDSLTQLGIWINLSNNKFTGAIPNLQGLYNELDISNNLLESVDDINCVAASSDYGYLLDLRNNKLNFSGLECLKSNANFNGTISPQQRIPLINNNPVLKAAAGGTLASNTYKWYRNAVLVATITGDSTLTITTAGLYHCVVTNSNVPSVELRTDSVNISSVSSRKAQELTTEETGIYGGNLSVYPNPAGGDAIYIKGLRKAESIVLYNAAGQIVKQWQNVNGNQQLHIGALAEGVYMIRITQAGNQTMLKFVKQ
ncbi:MAG: T9SS type A sorting domain-containing protein [Agriterribacter sp.]